MALVSIGPGLRRIAFDEWRGQGGGPREWLGFLARSGVNMVRGLEVYTIGHSTLSMEDFVSLASGAGITAIADVRSTPYSRRNPQFNREDIASALKRRGIAYVWLGDGLGARPSDPSLYRPDGGVDFGRLAASQKFASGIDRVIDGAKRYRVALMCAERDPVDCHRTILVARHVAAKGIAVSHVLDGGLVAEQKEIEQRILARAFPRGPGLFITEGNEALREAYDRLGDGMTKRRARG